MSAPIRFENTTESGSAASPPTFGSGDFWNEFANRYWEKEPLAIQDSLLDPPTTPRDLFQMTVTRCDRLRFFADGKSYNLNEHPEFLPQESDGDFFGYDERVSALVPDQEFVLVIDNLYPNEAFWKWTQGFLTNLRRHVGPIGIGHFYSAFYGKYQRTPFGVHVDRESAFYFPIKGSKTMRVWDAGYARSHPKLRWSKTYDAYKDGSTLITAAAGGMLYWPFNRWHIGESKGGDVSVTMAVNRDFDFYEDIHFYLMKSLWASKLRLRVAQLRATIHEMVARPITQGTVPPRARRPEDFALSDEDPQSRAQRIPEDIEAAARAFRKVAGRRHVEIAAIRVWLDFLTGQGLRSQIPLRKREPLEDDDVLRLDPEHPVLYRRTTSSSRLVGSCRGHSFHTPWHANIARLCERLNDGEEHPVGRLREEHRGFSGDDGNEWELSEKFIRTILNFFHEASFLEKV